jgi:threonine/homoserine/homoserine lactone efflux protein
MIEFKLFFALISYYFVMFATPGPNNAMLTASGIKFGFRKTLPHLVGIPFGHVIQITLVCFGLGSLFQRYPLIQFYLKWLCFVYLLYLGWRIIGSFSNNEKEAGRPLKFYEAALFQFVNPKAWVVALTAATAFFPNEENFIDDPNIAHKQIEGKQINGAVIATNNVAIIKFSSFGKNAVAAVNATTHALGLTN